VCNHRQTLCSSSNGFRSSISDRNTYGPIEVSSQLCQLWHSSIWTDPIGKRVANLDTPLTVRRERVNLAQDNRWNHRIDNWLIISSLHWFSWRCSDHLSPASVVPTVPCYNCCRVFSSGRRDAMPCLTFTAISWQHYNCQVVRLRAIRWYSWIPLTNIRVHFFIKNCWFARSSQNNLI